ncbi:MAG: ATP-binding cassette domain-containing protein [Gammaproteobacteria bacterium SHHR-1]|uniref:ATP-binding cassette domain-containing protein n=1 Tax=Magnetovirga frankeli TaxID=947516 RepID=UPI00129301D0|nr:ATP-binding cassette domain-containing protein [gamma proteobacterium SS-5]
MPTVSEGADKATEGLGERLLRLIPTRKQQQNDQSPPSKPPLVAQLFKLGSQDSLARLAWIAVLAAFCGNGVLLLLNMEVKQLERHDYSTLTALLFAGLLVVYRLSQNHLIRKSAEAIESALDRQRQRVVGDVLNLSLRDVEQLNDDHLRDGVAAQYSALSQTLVPLVAGVEGLILLVFMFAYVVSISAFVGLLTVLVLSVTVIGYLNKSKQLDAEMSDASQADAHFRQLTDAIVHGAKELQLSLGRRNALQEAMNTSSQAIARGRTRSAAQFAEIIATGTTISYLLVGAVVFIMPLIVNQEGSDISREVIAVIFLLGPIGSVVQAMQQYATAQFALRVINEFEAKVASCRKATESVRGGDKAIPAQDFSELRLEALRYQHLGEQGFAIEQIDLRLKRGQILFLTGGNGSGKTTLLRVLTGLYPRAGGKIILNGQELPLMPPQSYRELFASVFSDFHLFDRPYGLDEQSMQRFDHWLRQLGVRDKLADSLDHLPTAKLSTGQRKRLALAYVLAEKRPILVLDEWAADQDPQTRQRFYEQILPQLKAEGYTIFCITHDEHYFHCCDQRLHMVEGRLSQELL